MIPYTRYIVDKAKKISLKNIEKQNLAFVLHGVVQKIIHDNNIDMHFIIDNIIRNKITYEVTFNNIDVHFIFSTTPQQHLIVVPQKPNKSYLSLLEHVK